ncbi:MAG: DegV family protein [Anaerolineaceae bacterium]
MGRISIITDSSAYLPQAYVDQYQITVIPLTLNWEGKSYADGVDISATDFYRKLKTSKTIPTTSQLSTGQFINVFKPLLDAGNDVFYAGISLGISATYNSAIQAKADLGNPPNLLVMDSQLVSMALSFLILEVAKAAETGATLEECKRVAEETFPKIGVFFTVDTLEYLHKGGRINTAKRLLGSTLNVKPLLEIRGGKIELVESVISRKKAISRMLDLVEKHIEGASPVRLAPFHALCEDECLEMEAAAVERFHPIEVIRSEVSPVVGAHVGPGTLSLAWMAG